MRLALNNLGLRCIQLDGDELRFICASLIPQEQEFESTTRFALAKLYSRLAKYLGDQNNLVIVSTISMDKRIYKLNRESIKNYIEIFIDRPLDDIMEEKPDYFIKKIKFKM